MYSLKVWVNPGNDCDIRLYIGGTTRQSLYLKQARDDGRLVWSSKANDTPPKFRTGDHYGKVNKDRDAAAKACDAFGLELGGQDWGRALKIAEAGLEVEE